MGDASNAVALENSWDEQLELPEGRKRMSGILRTLAELYDKNIDSDDISGVLDKLLKDVVGPDSYKLKPSDTDLEAQDVADRELPTIFRKMREVMREGVTPIQIEKALNSRLGQPQEPGIVKTIPQK